MPRLIHLNGPSRVGKSTLARRFAHDHPGTLMLDLDVLVGLVGGWEENFQSALEVARDLGRDMAIRHLRSGNDVVLPQLVTSYDRVPDPAFEMAARSIGATYVHVVLLVDERENLRRLRGKRPDTEVEARIQAALEARSSDLLATIRNDLNGYLDGHPPTIQLDMTGVAEEESYRRLVAALDLS